MNLPDDIAEYGITLKDQYFDLNGLSLYSSMKVRTLRNRIRFEGLPCFKVKGKILVRRTEFDRWMEGYRVDKNEELDRIADKVLEDLESA